ncbi:MAG: hypothetical protein SAL70_06660 [Scytonema sp. PMC 1070.18]|nr:hypothetical protein [Scytonema sp. PMC 1070.18]
MSKRTPESMRRVVAARARGYCEYCRCWERFATESFTVEHMFLGYSLFGDTDVV